MTHTMSTFLAPFVDIVSAFHDPIYSASRLYSQFNYGEMIIDPSNLKVNVTIRGIDGSSHLGHVIDLKSDLLFNVTKLSLNQELCINL